jgi:hypothetical protein
MDSAGHLQNPSRRGMTAPTATGDMPALLLGGLAAFAAYFAMYAFRKPLAVAGWTDVGFHPLGLDYKTALVIVQVLGYAASKLVGIRVMAGFDRTGRARAIFLLILLAWAALVGFALVPPGLGLVLILGNGFALGMIWGLVFSYLEGRRVTELLGAMLCAAFILASGVVKSAGALLLQAGVAERWMPAATGLPFFPLLIIALWQLERLPPPSAADEAERTPRRPMDKADRAAFLRAHGLPLALLSASYVVLTALRDFRDNFAAELWAGLGQGGSAAVFAQSELPVAVIALGGLAALILVRDNLKAMLAMHGVIMLGGLLLGLGTLAFQAGLIGAMAWMVLCGAGLYLAYLPFNAMLFDRMIAVLGRPANAGFLIYIADTAGYAGSVALLLWRSLLAPAVDWVPLFIACAHVAAVLILLLTAGSALYFLRRAGQVREVPSV